jgi:hypothetical protein
MVGGRQASRRGFKDTLADNTFLRGFLLNSIDVFHFVVLNIRDDNELR